MIYLMGVVNVYIELFLVQGYWVEVWLLEVCQCLVGVVEVIYLGIGEGGWVLELIILCYFDGQLVSLICYCYVVFCSELFVDYQGGLLCCYLVDKGLLLICIYSLIGVCLFNCEEVVCLLMFCYVLLFIVFILFCDCIG